MTGIHGFKRVRVLFPFPDVGGFSMRSVNGQLPRYRNVHSSVRCPFCRESLLEAVDRVGDCGRVAGFVEDGLRAMVSDVPPEARVFRCPPCALEFVSLPDSPMEAS